MTVLSQGSEFSTFFSNSCVTLKELFKVIGVASLNFRIFSAIKTIFKTEMQNQINRFDSGASCGPAEAPYPLKPQSAAHGSESVKSYIQFYPGGRGFTNYSTFSTYLLCKIIRNLHIKSFQFVDLPQGGHILNHCFSVILLFFRVL